MKFDLVIIGAALLVTGCTPAPRYGTEKTDRSHHVPPVPERKLPDRSVAETTRVEDYYRLGWILQAYLGRPYKSNSQYQPGLDCSEFTREVFREYLHTEIPRTSEEQFNLGREIPKARLEFGDLVFFRTDGNSVSHVGVWVGYDEFIHASSSEGVIISRMDEKYWSKRYAGARRILE
jgi:cell wall-associated NlpC family hydrolase